MSDEGIETAEAHRNTHAHFKKGREFEQYQELYLVRVLPCLTKEEELRKSLEDPSLSGKSSQVALDLERLERIHSSIKSEVQKIESSLDWTNSNSLISAVNEFQHTLQETKRIVEQGKNSLIFIRIQKACDTIQKSIVKDYVRLHYHMQRKRILFLVVRGNNGVL